MNPTEPSPASGAAVTPNAAYVHVPFCRHRCGYCNFTLLAGRDDLIPRYLAALEHELRVQGPPQPVATLFFGGGTPSHLPLAGLRQLAAAVLHQFPLRPDYEWSLEANPRDVTDDWCRTAAELGATRISLGAQSFSPRKLHLLERDHDGPVIESAATSIRRHGMQVAVDLIFGVPGESQDEWHADLAQVLKLEPEHISTYGLTFEKGTRFWGRQLRGELRPLEQDLEAELYERALDVLTAAGFEHYEVSNFARPGCRCRHNEAYWLGHAYYGVGSGAASYLNGTRRMNHRGTLQYLRLIEQGASPVVETETLSDEDRARERLVFGLRRLQGVSRACFARENGVTLDSLGGDPLRSFIAQGWLAAEGDTVRLTRRGLLISDALWPSLLVPASTPAR